MVILFNLALTALVVMSFVLVVAAPVILASPQNWDRFQKLLFFGGSIWIVLVLVVGSLNFLVI